MLTQELTCASALTCQRPSLTGRRDLFFLITYLDRFPADLPVCSKFANMLQLKGHVSGASMCFWPTPQVSLAWELHMDDLALALASFHSREFRRMARRRVEFCGFRGPWQVARHEEMSMGQV